MTSRRTFLGLGVAAALAPLTVVADSPGPTTITGISPAALRGHHPLYKVVHDVRFAASHAFATRIAEHGVPVAPIDADITSLWFHDLALRWRSAPAAIAGLSAPEALFCLEQLAWEHRMRTLLRIEHVPAGRGLIEHRLSGPVRLHEEAESLLMQRPMHWAAAVADLVLHFPGTTYGGESARGFARWAAPDRSGDTLTAPLVSWLIAPLPA